MLTGQTSDSWLKKAGHSTKCASESSAFRKVSSHREKNAARALGAYWRHIFRLLPWLAPIYRGFRMWTRTVRRFGSTRAAASATARGTVTTTALLRVL